MQPAETMLDENVFKQDDTMNTQDDQIHMDDFVDYTSTTEEKSSNKDTNFVVGFVADFFASYKHIKDNKEKFILFISLTVAIGLSLFLALFLWNMYRSNRLERIAKSLRQPNLSQSTLCSASGVFTNGGGGRAASDNGTINAFTNHSTSTLTASSPTHSPNCPPGAIDIELEVGDHEVDTMFRDPGPKPLIVARSTPPLQV
jgi:hypothetical protein